MINPLSQEQAFATVLRDAPADARFLFDCDGTLIRGDINNACFRALLPLGLIDSHVLPGEWQHRSFFNLSSDEYKSLIHDVVKAHGLRGSFEWEIKAFRGLPRKTVRETALRILGGKTGDHSIETHTHAWHLAHLVKDRAWIVSGSERGCIEAVADLVGIARERVVATELQEVDGILGSAFEEPGINWEENKVKSLQQRGITDAYLCAGDSMGDWELLHLSTAWRWCVVEVGEQVPDYKRVFRDRLLEEIGLSASSLSLGIFEVKKPPGLKTILQVVNHHN